MNRLKKSRFSTARLTPRGRLPAWRESIGALFDVAPEGGAENFDASLTSYLLGGQVMLSRCQTSAQRFERGALRVARDGLDHYLIQTHLRGSQVVKRGRARLHCEPGDLMVIDLADRHDALTTDFDNLSLVVPRSLLAPRLRDPDSQEGRVLNGKAGLAALGVAHMKRIWELAPCLSPADVDHVIEPTIALLAGVLNGTGDAEGAAHAFLSPLTRVKLGIEQRLQRDLPIPALCRELNVSKTTLYRLMAPYGGVRAYIQERRLRRCAAELLSPLHAGRRVYEIAFQWGFASEAHFSRAFKRKYGVSPSEARKFGAAMRRRRSEIPEEVGDRDYERWLVEHLRA